MLFLRNKYTVWFLITINSFAFINQRQILAADDAIDLGEVVISPKKEDYESPLEYLDEIDSQAISTLAISSIEDALDTFKNVEVKRRGAYGGQADLSIRGSSFDQVSVLLNGIMINDVQTGHYTMDVPLPVEIIDKIEVSSAGQASSYEASALAGSVNITTKVPAEKKIIIDNSLGEHQLKRNLISISQPIKNYRNRLTFEHKESSGYRPDTDFRITTFAFESAGDYYDFFGGYTQNDLGASNSYSNLYPSEEDHTKTSFLSLKFKKEMKGVKCEPAGYYRRHEDKFILDRYRPQWYVNNHTDYDYGFDLPLSFEFQNNRLVSGIKLNQSKITSTRLGDHSREQIGLYASLNSRITPMTNFNLNLRGDFFNDWSRQINPLVKIDHQINDDWSLMVSGAGSYRLPTFTDLYYVSPANIGNENLTPETAATYETGVCYEKKQHKLMLNIFYRDADDIIDWTRNNSADPWQADNISRTKTIGSEAEWDFIINYKNRFLNLEKTSLGYAYLNTSYSQKEAMEVKYTSDYLKHKVVFEAYLEYPFMLKQSLKLRYNRRISDEDYFLLDTKISKGFIKEKYSAEVYLSASNIFNTSYCEVRDVAMPGRWIESGVKITF